MERRRGEGQEQREIEVEGEGEGKEGGRGRGKGEGEGEGREKENERSPMISFLEINSPPIPPGIYTPLQELLLSYSFNLTTKQLYFET